MKNALWIKGYEGLYKVLPNGKIYSFVRNPEKGKLLKPRVSGSGYLMVTLSGVQTYVQQIVAEHYLINRNKKKYTLVAFEDGNPLNVKVSNLFWTDSTGRSKKYLQNKKKSLKRKGMVTNTISTKDLLKIAKLLKQSGLKNKQETIAEKYGIHRITLYRLRKTKEFKKILQSV